MEKKSQFEIDQQKLYDEQLKKFIKDKKANAALKAKPMAESLMTFKQYMAEAKKKHDDTEEDKELIKKMVKPEALKEDEELEEGNGAYMAAVAAMPAAAYVGAKLGAKLHDLAVKRAHKQIDASNAKRKATIAAKKSLKEDEELEENSPFDWKGKSSIFTKKDEPEISAQGGTIHKARTTQRNAETGGAKEKQSVGRPKGEYGSYKIDKAKRDDPEYKKNLSQKVINAKKEGFAARDEFKKHMHDAIMRHQLRQAGIDPKDHEAQIAKKNPVKK